MRNVTRSRLLAWVRSGWGGLSFVGLFHSAINYVPSIWRRISDISTVQSVISWTGLDMPIFISIVSNPVFGLALILTGLLGLPTIDKIGKYEAAWRFAGWVVFVLSVSAVGSTLLFESFVAQTGIDKLERLYSKSLMERHLSKNQIEKIEADLCPVVKQYEPMAVLAVEDVEARQYAQEFLGIFVDCHFNVTLNEIDGEHYPVSIQELNTSIRGLNVTVINKEHPDLISQHLYNILQKNGLDPSYSQRGKGFPPLNGIYVSYK